MCTKPPRQPCIKTPKEYGMEYESINFYSSDGVKLSAWEIGCSGSNRLAIITHPLGCNKYGFNPNHPGANKQTGYKIELLKLAKVLYDAGYNVLTMDMRGHGESGHSKQQINSVGPHGSMDIIGC